MPNSLSKVSVHSTSAVAFARDLYSASVLDWDTVACFFAFKDMRFEPRKIAKPPVDLLSSGHPAQSASEKALTAVEEDLHNLSPVSTLPWRYLKILFKVVQCTVLGACRNWQTLLTEKEISGHVKVKYWSAPTTLLYFVPSSGLSNSPSCNDSFSVIDRGVLHGLQSFMPTCFSMSVAYFS